MPPMVIARLLDALTIEPDNVALVIGAGSGYERLCWVGSPTPWWLSTTIRPWSLK